MLERRRQPWALGHNGTLDIMLRIILGHFLGVEPRQLRSNDVFGDPQVKPASSQPLTIARV